MAYINSVFKYVENGKRIRIVNIIQSSVYLVNIDAKTTMPRKELIKTIQEEIDGEKLIAIKDPFARIINEEELSEPEINRRNASWELVDKYWESGKYELLEKNNRENKFKDIAKTSGLSLTKVKIIFSRYWQRGMNKNALLPDYMNSGGKGKERKLSHLKEGVSITEEVKKHFKFAIDSYYYSNKNTSLRGTYALMLMDFYSDKYIENNETKLICWDDERIPKYNQFYYWFKKSNEVKNNIILRHRDREANLKHRLLISKTDSLGMRVLIDAVIADVYLVSSLNPTKIIGRPIVYSISDVNSGVITGIYVGLEGPSWLGATMALDNMMADKVQFCKEYGIEITEEQWPSKHLPNTIIVDGGKFEGYSPEDLINNLSVRIETSSNYNDELKCIVERNFKTIDTKINHRTPDAIEKEFRKRGDKDYKLDSILTIKEFTKIYINIVLHHNMNLIEKYPLEKEMIEDGVLPIPIQIWNWRIKNNRCIVQNFDRDLIRMNILPRGKASVCRSGIKFKGLSYSFNKAISEQCFLKSKVRTVKIVYDPRNINKIYIPYDNGLGYEECYLMETCNKYKNCISEEIIFNQESVDELKEKYLRERKPKNIDYKNEIEKIVKEAKIARLKELSVLKEKLDTSME